MSKQKISTKQIVESAIFLALGFVLSMIKIKLIAVGGSITLVSMLPIVLITYRYGTGWGTLFGAVHGLLQMLEGGLYAPPTETALSYIAVILLDYIVAWAAVGLLSGLVMKAIDNPKISVTVGSVVGIFGRFLCSFTSGVIIWGVYAPEGQSPAIYSLLINGSVMLPEAIFTGIVAFILFSFPAIQKLFTTPVVAESK